MEFAYPHLNIVGIIVAAVAQFVLGFLWYSPMTPPGRLWLSEMRMDPSSMGRPGLSMAVFPISSIFAAWAVAMVVGWAQADSLVPGILAAWVVAAAVIAQTAASAVANRQTVRLAAIHISYLVVGYTIMGIILGHLH